MTDEQVFAICYANATNRYVCQHLDGVTMDLCVSILMELDANEFKEINPDAEFDFLCLPIPYDKIAGFDGAGQTNYSPNVQKEFDKLLDLINKEGTNKEYSYALIGLQEENEKYSGIYSMNVGSSQSVEYDWNRIQEFLQSDQKNVNFSIFHTHPKAISEQHNTLFNKHQEIFEEFGVRPDGLNISLSDIYANQYLDMLCAKYGRDDITCESTILMHDGALISFATKNGVELTGQQYFEKNKQNDQQASKSSESSLKL